jgi:hypothetical protein
MRIHNSRQSDKNSCGLHLEVVQIQQSDFDKNNEQVPATQVLSHSLLISFLFSINPKEAFKHPFRLGT